VKVLRPSFIVGCGLLYYCVVARYPPLGTGKYLVGLFILCFCAGILLFGIPNADRITPKYLAISFLPWVLAVLFVVNGLFDNSNEVRHPTVVVESHYYRGPTSVIVRSWRPGETTVTLYVSRWAPFFLQGQPVTVAVKPGALGITWISSIYRK